MKSASIGSGQWGSASKHKMSPDLPAGPTFWGRGPVCAIKKPLTADHVPLQNQRVGVMSVMENTSYDPCDSSAAGPTAVESLKMLLDYAIAEGSELRLPVFVLLLKMADLELAKGARERHVTSDAPSLRDAGERVAP
jgi:hypothetical protein